MPRPKAYNENKVLTSAMLCFWHLGYTATSLKNLEEATGLKPSSLYNAFESKDVLFLKALDHYIENVVEQRINTLTTSTDPIAGIKNYVLSCFEGKQGSRRVGCLLINTSTEMGPHDELVRAKVTHGIRKVNKGLQKALVRAIDEGRLDKDIDAKQRAIHIGLLLSGMLVNGRIASDRSWLNPAMKSLEELLH